MNLTHSNDGNLQTAGIKMTSYEIASLLDSRHDSVKRTIERLINQSVIAQPPMVDMQECGGNNRTYTTQVYEFSGEQGKRDSIIVVAQLSPQFTAKLVDRWRELEKQLTQPFTDPMQALNDPEFLRGTLLSYSEKVISLQHTVKEMQPKVTAFDRIATSSAGSLAITDAAKALQIQPKKLFTWLQCNNWIYRRAGGRHYLGYQDKIRQRLLEHKITMIARSDGSEKMVEQVLITSKGIARLSDLTGDSLLSA